MATEAAAAALPQSTSRYRMLRGKSISSPRVLDIFRDTDKSEESPIRRLRSSSVHTLRARRGGDKSAPDVPALPSYALTPKPVNIPLPPTFNKCDDSPRPGSANPLQGEGDVHDKYTAEPLDESPASPLQQARSKSKRMLFGRKEVENELPDPERLEGEAQRIIADQKRQDLARLQATLVTPPPKSKPSLFNLFSRSRKLPTPTLHPDTPSSFATTVFTSRGNSLETTSNPDSTKFSDFMETPSLFSHTPELTPVMHASQTFERRVAVRCQSSTISLPVASETNAVDILFMASTMMRHHINPANSVVVESYLMMGLERRLRRYERIRDVMNSWDKDHENSLLILGCPASMSDHDLDLDAVPNSNGNPPGFNLQLYQSSRPGKWNKRWITLLENGQMYSAKTADALPGDATCVQLCHMADFDIYTPKETEIRQSVKPPKKFCYAIKSQQKSVQFSDEVNFVHFFSTDNAEVATQFYELVHGWRSWLLVARKLALDRKMNAPAPQLTFDSADGLDAAADQPNADSALSSATPSFRIGSFQPLLDLDNIPKLAEEARKLLPAAPPEPATPDGKLDARPPPPDFPPPATPAPKAKDQAARPSLKRADTDKSPGVSPSSMYHPSPGLRLDRLQTSPQANSTGLEFDAFIFDVPEEKRKPEPTSWFPSAAEHTAKLRKDEPPPVRRPATADAAMHGQRRPNRPPPIKTHFLELPRPFEHFGIPPPKTSPNGLPPPVYNLPGTPMMPSAPRARPMPRSNTGNLASAEPQSGLRPRSRSTAGNGQPRRQELGNMPPVPSLPSRPMNGDAASQAPSVPLPVQPRHSPRQRGPAVQPSPRQI